MSTKNLLWSALLATAMVAGCKGDDGGDECVDEDGDGFFSDSCATGDDCDDSNADVNPDADEVLDNAVDEDCDGVVGETEEDPDAPDTIDEAKEVVTTLGENAAQNDAIQEAGDRDFWKINTLAGNWYILWAERRGIDPGSPDTVLRVYNSAKEEIAENDDMPYRMKDTDAAHLFQAVADETIYIEVLEWSDWAEDGAIGDPSYVYRMNIIETEIEENNPDNDTFAEVAAYTDPQWSLFPFSDSWPYWSPGVIDPAGDVDIVPVNFLADDSLCQFGFWPDSPSLINPVLSVYWEDCLPATDTEPTTCTGEDVVLIAQTSDPETRPVGTFISEDAGVTAYIPSGVYYAQVEDADGMGGTGYFYNLMTSCYLTDWFEIEFEDGQNTPRSNTPVTMDDTNADGRFFGTFHGSRQKLTPGSDDMDTFKVSNALGNGKYMTVNLEAENVGSIVGDIKMTFWYEEAGEFKELATVTDPNPRIRDHQLTSKETAVYVTLEYPGAYSGPASQYFGTVIIDDVPVYE